MAQGNPQDSFVQVATDGTGKKIDNAELTRDDGEIVFRQRTVLSSDENPRQQVTVGGSQGHTYILTDSRSFDVMIEKLQELIDTIKFLNGMS